MSKVKRCRSKDRYRIDNVDNAFTVVMNLSRFSIELLGDAVVNDEN
jgi:hypothetical protein